MFVHVGLPKTGTTHIQTILAANRRLLADQGLLYPRASRGRQHFLPVLDFMQVPFGGIQPADVTGLWDEMHDKVMEWRGRSLISHELLSGVRPRQVAQLVEGFAPRTVHVIISGRDLSRLLPAVWQERAKNQQVEGWADFRAAVAQGPEGRHPFWRLHDLHKVISVWRKHIPDEHIHVITLPRAGSGQQLLLDRFSSVLGIEAGQFRVPAVSANESIGLLELAVLREVNLVAGQRMDPQTYRWLVKRRLVPDVLSKRSGQVKAVLPESDRPWIEAYTDKVRATLSTGGFDIVGDLDELTPQSFAGDDPAGAEQTGEFSKEVVAQAMAEVVVELLSLGQPAGVAEVDEDERPTFAGRRTAAGTHPQRRSLKALPAAAGSRIRGRARSLAAAVSRLVKR